MSFLGKIFRRPDSAGERGDDSPVRNRTFSATQFRENELARAAEARTRAQEPEVEAAQVLSPAVNPIAEALMAEDREPVEAFETVEDIEPAPAPTPVDEAEQLEGFEPAEDSEMSMAEADPAEENEAVESTEPADEPESALAEADPVEENEVVEDVGPAVAFEPAPVAAPSPLPVDPMPWDEAVGWLSQRSAETRNFVGTYWNWDYDLRVLHFLAQQPDLDAGVAAHIFWITAACEDYFPFGDDEPDSEISQQIFWLTDFLGRRFSEGAFRPASYGFDDSWDCVRLKKRLADLHSKDRLPWSPDEIPTNSTAELMSFDDIPEDEREDVGQFLARFGVY